MQMDRQRTNALCVIFLFEIICPFCMVRGNLAHVGLHVNPSRLVTICEPLDSRFCAAEGACRVSHDREGPEVSFQRMVDHELADER